ncbi:hypothetical protein, partial [Phytohabitans houttuyneae]|uniref:hypothetical protein n=1 Tax=Phytohabitans houttuyneae TaxID=1076126 RepID=UPI0031EBE3E7
GGRRRRTLPDELDRLPGLPGLVDEGVEVADGGRTRVACAVVRAVRSSRAMVRRLAADFGGPSTIW